MKTLSCLAIAVTAVALLSAADTTGNRKATNNPKSPSAETSVKLGNHTVTIEYNAPSARGRKVEGGLIPYGKDAWYRMGADSATTLTTDTNLTIGDLEVPKGVYTLYLQAEEGAWKLIVNKQTGQWGTVYKPEMDLGRTALKLTKTAAPVETFKITLSGQGSAGTLAIEWGNTRATVPIKAAM